jgi:hypothetical protein
LSIWNTVLDILWMSLRILLWQSAFKYIHGFYLLFTFQMLA